MGTRERFCAILSLTFRSRSSSRGSSAGQANIPRTRRSVDERSRGNCSHDNCTGPTVQGYNASPNQPGTAHRVGTQVGHSGPGGERPLTIQNPELSSNWVSFAKTRIVRPGRPGFGLVSQNGAKRSARGFGFVPQNGVRRSARGFGFVPQECTPNPAATPQAENAALHQRLFIDCPPQWWH